MKFFHTHLPDFSKIALLALFTLILPIESYGMDVFFQWAGDQEPGTEYKLYYKQGVSSALPYTGTDLNEGKSPITTGDVTTYTVTGLDPNKTYHFALTAYNEDGESGYSSIVTVNPTPTITIISPN